MGTVTALHIGKRSGIPMTPLTEADIITDYGVDGDHSAKAGSKRQVLIMPGEVLDALGLEPGTVKENITTRGFDVMSLPRGAKVRVGGALLEATIECTPCGLMDDIRPGLQEELRGQRGMLFRVLEGGPVRIGDAVERVADD
ncbi:MAG TPA: MOSC domain-containing protein [Aggregatilineales bacterium]|nr:MOSC domain-containing protein [Aggregatilineales bacterium]